MRRVLRMNFRSNVVTKDELFSLEDSLPQVKNLAAKCCVFKYSSLYIIVFSISSLSSKWISQASFQAVSNQRFVSIKQGGRS